MASAPGRSRLVQLVIGVAVSAVLLYVALRGQDWDEIGAVLAQANYLYIPVIIAVSVYSLLIRAQRWQALIERALGRKQALAPVFSSTAIGFMANSVLPLRAGEVVRPWLLTRLGGVPVSTAFATAVLERVLDMIAVLVLLMVVAGTAGFEEPIKSIATYACVAAAIGLAAIFFIHRQKDRYLPVVDRIWRVLPTAISVKVIALEHGFFDGLASIAETTVLLRLVAWSLYLWLVIALTFYLASLAVGIHIGYLGSGVAVAAVVALAVALPSAPGFVGVWQAGCLSALSIYGVAPGPAVAVSLLSHAMAFMTQIPLGLVCLLREGLSFGELGKAREEAEEAEATVAVGSPEIPRSK